MQCSEDEKRDADQSDSVKKKVDSSFRAHLPWAYPSQSTMLEAANSTSPLISSSIEPHVVSSKSLCIYVIVSIVNMSVGQHVGRRRLSVSNRLVFDLTGQTSPLPIEYDITMTLWEDEGTLCYVVVVLGGLSVPRREDNRMINGTKLLRSLGCF